MERPARDTHRRGSLACAEHSTARIRANRAQGTGDNFYKQKQLLPENFIEAAKEAGNDKGINLRLQPDYDHSYYFMATFADDHVAWAAKHLGI